MKYSDMNAHERAAFRFIQQEMSDYIGGLENDIADCTEDCEKAQALLNQSHDDLVEDIYIRIMSRAKGTTYDHLKFATSNWIKERISRRLTKWGY